MYWKITFLFKNQKCIVSSIITLCQFLHKGMNGPGLYWRHTLVKGMCGCRVDQSPLPFFICHQHWCKENRSGVSVLSWNVAEHRAFLCSRGFRWFAVTAEAAGSGKAGWGVGVGVMDIFVWCGRWDEKTVGELLLPASLCVKSALCSFHLISSKRMWSCTCMKSAPWKRGRWPICALQTSSKCFRCFFTAVIYDVVVTPHI